MMQGGCCVPCCGPIPPFCMPCGSGGLPPANLSFGAPTKIKGLPPPKVTGPCKMLNTPLGPKPDTLLIPIFMDEHDSQPRIRHASKKHLVADDAPRRRRKGSAKIHRIRAKSRELRAGILYMGCDCEKRNGLQDDCRRTGCQGSPECLTNPPSCGPSAYSSGKHLVKMSETWKAKHHIY